MQYSENERPAISVPWPSKLWPNLVISTVYHLLRKDPSQRPTATSVLDILKSYKTVLVRPLAEPIFEMAYVSFPEWLVLLARCSSETEWLYELQGHLRVRGVEFKAVAKILLEESVHQYFETIERLHEFNLRNLEQDSEFAEDPQLENTKALFRKLLAHLPEWLVPWVCYEITVYVTSRTILLDRCDFYLRGRNGQFSPECSPSDVTEQIIRRTRPLRRCGGDRAEIFCQAC